MEHIIEELFKKLEFSRILQEIHEITKFCIALGKITDECNN